MRLSDGSSPIRLFSFFLTHIATENGRTDAYFGTEKEWTRRVSCLRFPRRARHVSVVIKVEKLRNEPSDVLSFPLTSKTDGKQYSGEDSPRGRTAGRSTRRGEWGRGWTIWGLH